MVFKPLFWVGVLTLIVAPVLHGQDSVPVLRLGDLYRSLPAASPRIAAATALARAAEFRIAPARRPPDPQVQVGWMNRMLPGLERNDPLGMDQIQVMQMLPVAGQLGLAGRAASERAAAEHARATDVEWEVRARAAMAYYDLYRMDRSLVVAHETLRLLQDLLKQAETMYGVGEGRQADVLRAQVEVARMTEEILRMEADRLGAAARLNALVARSPYQVIGTPMLPRFPVELPPLDSLIANADARRPMVQVAQANVRAADADAKRARREIWPDLQVGVQYGQRPMADGSTDRMVSLMLGASVPIFAGSRQLAMRREAEAMRTMVGAELEEMRADTRGRVGELHAVVERARRLGDLYRGTILPQADATVLSARAAYRVGAVDFMTVLDDQMTVNRYRQDLIALDAERGQSLAELEMLLGRELFDPSAVSEDGAPR
ncbi:MAG: TolC family protein [Gemmatimonadota bacterium]